jgi:hypothetical protein
MQRAERTARPKPTGWKARATWHGLSSPCRGDRGSRRSHIAAHAIWQRAEGGGRCSSEAGLRVDEKCQSFTG